jgi:predicted nucleotidyltransferase
MNIETEMIEPFLKKLDAALGTRYSAVLYGSVVRNEHVPGLSDVNLMLIVDRLDSDTLTRLEPPFSDWVGHKLPPPQLMTAVEWSRASDVFPVEIADMKVAYRVLRGVDPVQGLSVARGDLRRALEYEFRGKLNRLRQGFVPSERHPDTLGAIARSSIASVAALYRALLTLVGRTPPVEMARTILDTATVVGFDAAPLTTISAHRADAGWNCSRETFEGYLRAVERTVAYVDELQLGDQE